MRIRAGDIFVYQMPDKLYRYGRVINTQATLGPFGKVNLIYLYAASSKTKQDILSRLTPKNLLLPPLMTSNLPWSRGYFEMIEHSELKPIDVLPRHSFCTTATKLFPKVRCYDEYSNEIDDPVEPIGTWGLKSFRAIDDLISKALGFELAPD